MCLDDVKADSLIIDRRILAFNYVKVIFFPWRYTTHSECVFYSPLSGFSLLAYEVT